jgi:hypothetical protein
VSRSSGPITTGFRPQPRSVLFSPRLALPRPGKPVRICEILSCKVDGQSGWLMARKWTWFQRAQVTKTVLRTSVMEDFGNL